MTLAGTLEAKGDYEKAISEYEYLLKQQPGVMVVVNNLASLLTDHRADKASLDRASSLAGVLRKSPVPAFKDTLGWIYYLRGEVKNAIPLLEEASKSLSNNSAVQYHLGMSYLADGQVAKASDQLKKALALNPDPSLRGQIQAAQEKAAM
jgi:tetratricopeptide (TPR) repeat protein